MISRYNYKPVSEIWTKKNQYLTWTKIELLFLKHFKNIEVFIPDDFKNEWIQEIEKREDLTKHDVAAFVSFLEDYLKPIIGDESRWIHWGLTSQDLNDNFLTLGIKQSNIIICNLIKEVFKTLDNLQEKYKHVEMTGRTHGQAAEKINLSDKFNAFSNSLCFCYEKIKNHRYFGRLRGSLGDSKYVSKDIEFNVLNDLGLEVCYFVDGQVINRVYFVDIINSWSLLAGVIAKITTDIRLLSLDCIEEINEFFGKENVGSSSMPQKRNPVLSENLCGLARIIRGHQTSVNQNMELWLERDISHSSVERYAFPDCSILIAFMLNRLNDILANLVVNEDKIEENLCKNIKKMSAQEQMLDLIEKGSSRSEAHKIMKEKYARSSI